VESALNIFAQLAHFIMPTLTQYMGTLDSLLQACLRSQKPEVAIAAMKATTAFIQALEDAQDRDKFQVGLAFFNPPPPSPHPQWPSSRAESDTGPGRSPDGPFLTSQSCIALRCSAFLLLPSINWRYGGRMRKASGFPNLPFMILLSFMS
jgi:hypothetical protein